MKKIYLSLLTMLLAVMTVSANTVLVQTPADLASLYGAAQDGDTLQLLTGSYTTKLSLPAGKSIVLYAADTSVVEYKAELVSDAGTSVEGGSITFDGIIIDRDNAYFMNLNGAGRFELLSFRNCVIRDITRSFLRTGVPDSSVLTSGINRLEMYNCVMSNCNTGNWNMIYPQIPINEVDIQQCTFYANDKVESLFAPRTTGGMSYSSETLNFVFKNNTVFQGARDANRAICNAGNNYGEESTFEFVDNIIVCPEGQTAGALIRAEIGLVTMHNNLVHNYSGAKVNLPILMDSVSNYALEDFSFTSTGQIFPDPANGDFTIYSVSPMATASTNEGIIGDAQWLKQSSNLVDLTVGYADGSDETFGSISGPSGLVEDGKEVTLTAAYNFGYRFVAWKDASGAILSEEPVYTFTLSGATTVQAAFRQINTYVLNVNVEGMVGNVSISEAGKDGEYSIYEEGVELTLTAVSNPISEFMFWGDFDSSPSKIIVMNQDQNITATFATKSFVCGWNFDTEKNDASNLREADFLGQFVTPANAPILSMYNSDDTSTPWSGWWNRTEKDRTAATFWKNRSSAENHFFWQTNISTVGYKDVTVKYALTGRYYGNDVWKLMYSYNGISFEVAGYDTVSTSAWVDREHVIPNTGDKETLYLRWTPDITSTLHGDIKDVDGTYIADIYILADESGTVGLNNPSDAVKPMALIQSGLMTLRNIEGRVEASLFGMDGRLVRSFQATEGSVVDCSNLKGVYVLRIGSAAVKVVF